MKIHSRDFRVAEGDEVDLEKWPTNVDPVYKSKDQYKKILDEHVAQLSALQQLHYASNRHARVVDFPGDGCRRKRRRHPACDVGGESAGLPGIQLQASQRRGAAARFSLAHDARSAGTRADRHFQPFLLRGSSDRARASRNFAQRRASGRACHDKKLWQDRYRSIADLERHLHATEPASSSSSSTFRRKNSASVFSRASTSRKRTGSSAWPTLRSANSGSII